MEVQITKRYRGEDKSSQNSSAYNFGGAGNTIINNYGTAWPEDSIATFVNNQNPAINDWTIYANIYGQYPKFTMIIQAEDGVDNGAPTGEDWEYEFTVPPKRVRIEGLLTRVEWDLPNIMTGYIVISK